ncbi:hypothetical protein [Holophaga foetida]|uniref:hypothetical protein n=1 Tax=Holophaga foetida TaxID=35839 RepID=UPI0002475051|nr:hypothetical protein [Holophaga foetida]
MIRPLLCLVLASTLGAQGGPGMGGGRRGMGWRQGPVLIQLHQIRTQRIQQTLGVSEDRARAIADRWTRFDQDSMERHRQMRQLKQQLNGVLLGPGSEDEKNTRLKPLIQQFVILRRQQHDLRQSFESEIMNALTSVQQARMVILVDELQKSLREALKEGRSGE